MQEYQNNTLVFTVPLTYGYNDNLFKSDRASYQGSIARIKLSKIINTPIMKHLERGTGVFMAKSESSLSRGGKQRASGTKSFRLCSITKVNKSSPSGTRSLQKAKNN